MAASNFGASHALLSAAAALPLVICMRDSFFSLCEVQGSSMEPNLKHGGILLIRRADFPILRGFGDGPDKRTIAKDILDIKETDDEHDTSLSSLVMKSRRLRECEYQHHLARENSSVWFRCPPWPMRGQIVTYRSPYQYPTELCIKRVVGVAGQVVSMNSLQHTTVVIVESSCC